jgi:hypothetical protein
VPSSSGRAHPAHLGGGIAHTGLSHSQLARGWPQPASQRALRSPRVQMRASPLPRRRRRSHLGGPGGPRVANEHVLRLQASRVAISLRAADFSPCLMSEVICGKRRCRRPWWRSAA